MYAEAGAGEEVTVRRNRHAWQRLALVSAVLRDVSDVSTSLSPFGQQLSMPIMCAPVGSLTAYHPDGAVASASGSASAGSCGITGVLSSPAFPDVRAACGGRNLFQIYASGDDAWLDSLLERVTDAGARGICLTVDSPVHSRRDRLIADRPAPARASGSSSPPSPTRSSVPSRLRRWSSGPHRMVHGALQALTARCRDRDSGPPTPVAGRGGVNRAADQRITIDSRTNDS